MSETESRMRSADPFRTRWEEAARVIEGLEEEGSVGA